MGDSGTITPGWATPGTERGRAMAGHLTRLDAHRRVSEQSASLGTAVLRMLWMFADGRARTLREIAGRLGLEQSTVNRQVHAALDEGVLHRYHDDGRTAWLVEPTGTGRERFARDVAIGLGAFEQALAELGDDDAARLVELLDRFVPAYGAAVEERMPTPGG